MVRFASLCDPSFVARTLSQSLRPDKTGCRIWSQSVRRSFSSSIGAVGRSEEIRQKPGEDDSIQRF